MFKALKNTFNSVKNILSNKKIDNKSKNIESFVEDEKKIIKTNEKEITQKRQKLSSITKLKSIFYDRYFLNQEELHQILDDLEIKLLQTDFSIDVVDLMLQKLKNKIKKDGLSKKHFNEDLINKFKELIMEEMPKNYNKEFFENMSFEKTKKPYVIIFLGTNGTGKTTTIAKLAYFLKNNGKKVVLSASDTYRAASIEQLEGHSKIIGVPVIKGKYNQDPASVAFDTVKYAENKQIDFVLIDTAGRQDNNKLLMDELKKIKRVVNADMLVFVSEALVGQTAIIQAETFNKEIGFDSFVLTKVDVDEKGGTLLSISIGLKKPNLFLGVGQEYKDLIFLNNSFLDNMF